MPWDVEYSADDDIICIMTTGTLTLQDMIGQAVKALELDETHDTHRFLSDIREVADVPKVTELATVPAVYDDLGAQRINKLAVIVSSSSDNSRAYEFFETVCVNRGWNVRFFSNRQDAVKWLRPD